MSIYPIKIHKVTMFADSKSGGKEYHVVLVRTANDRTLLINRWGKQGQWGTGFTVDKYDEHDTFTPNNEFTKKIKEKSEHGSSQKSLYGIANNNEYFVNDEAAFKLKMGQYWFKIGEEAIEFISEGTIDGSDSKLQPNAVWNKKADGSIENVTRPIVKEKPAPKQSAEAILAERTESNKDYGLF